MSPALLGPALCCYAIFYAIRYPLLSSEVSAALLGTTAGYLRRYRFCYYAIFYAIRYAFCLCLPAYLPRDARYSHTEASDHRFFRLASGVTSISNVASPLGAATCLLAATRTWRLRRREGLIDTIMLAWWSLRAATWASIMRMVNIKRLRFVSFRFVSRLGP